MKNIKAEVLAKCDQALSILSVEKNLTKNDDNVMSEIMAANLLNRGLLTEIKELIESSTLG
tara:strand:+ start:263 stop:445 length:183 start_codon:yes stop_codon:yes gene_type:complete